VRVSEIVNLVRRCYAEITDHCCYFNNNTLSFKYFYDGEPARFFGGNGTRIEPGLVLADPARIKRGNFLPNLGFTGRFLQEWIKGAAKSRDH